MRYKSLIYGNGWIKTSRNTYKDLENDIQNSNIMNTIFRVTWGIDNYCWRTFMQNRKKEIIENTIDTKLLSDHMGILRVLEFIENRLIREKTANHHE